MRCPLRRAYCSPPRQCGCRVGCVLRHRRPRWAPKQLVGKYAGLWPCCPLAFPRRAFCPPSPLHVAYAQVVDAVVLTVTTPCVCNGRRSVVEHEFFSLRRPFMDSERILWRDHPEAWPVTRYREVSEPGTPFCSHSTRSSCSLLSGPRDLAGTAFRDPLLSFLDSARV